MGFTRWAVCTNVICNGNNIIIRSTSPLVALLQYLMVASGLHPGIQESRGKPKVRNAVCNIMEKKQFAAVQASFRSTKKPAVVKPLTFMFKEFHSRANNLILPDKGKEQTKINP